MAKHGVFTKEQATSTASPVGVETAIPFVIGASPIHAASEAASVGVPVLCRSMEEAAEKLGYSEDWDKYNLCEVMHSHFVLYGMQPVIFVNLLDPSTMAQSAAAADLAVSEHKVLIAGAIKDENLVIKSAGGADAYTEDDDYMLYYDGDSLCIELLPDGAAYSAEQINVACKKVTPESVTAEIVAAGMESIDLCVTQLGIVPDLICAPGYSHDAAVGAVMATKAEGINGMFPAKALIDISTDADNGGANVYSAVPDVKAAAGLMTKEILPCWPLLGYKGKTYHMSTQLAAVIAAVDSEYGAPNASPSNHALMCDSLLAEDGGEILLTLAQANELNENGVVTALNFMGGFVAWGNYTACYPENNDIKDKFIPVSRMFGWVASTLIHTTWSKLDRPMTRLFVDNIQNTVNVWLNGLTGAGIIHGGRVEAKETENPVSDLQAGIVRYHIYMAPPTPAQEIDYALEFDISYLEAAFK